MNAYRHEYPLEAIRSAGFTELMDATAQQPYSFIFAGLAGTLDYAFASGVLKNNFDRRRFGTSMQPSLPKITCRETG